MGSSFHRTELCTESLPIPRQKARRTHHQPARRPRTVETAAVLGQPMSVFMEEAVQMLTVVRHLYCVRCYRHALDHFQMAALDRIVVPVLEVQMVQHRTTPRQGLKTARWIVSQLNTKQPGRQRKRSG